MDEFKNFSDDRLIRGCIYCGGLPETRDHIPSKCLLEAPYTSDLVVVGCCDSCNQSFSSDEQYLVCLIESVLCGSPDPEKIRRQSVARIMQNTPALRTRIKNSQIVKDGNVYFVPEADRIYNVMLKLARGHAAYELSQLCQAEPDHFWCGPLVSLPNENLLEFNSVHFQQYLGEVGSRNMQRLFVTQIRMQTEEGDSRNVELLCNDWIDVQENIYRYQAIEELGEIVIRIVIAEYLACEVVWII